MRMTGGAVGVAVAVVLVGRWFRWWLTICRARLTSSVDMGVLSFALGLVLLADPAGQRAAGALDRQSRVRRIAGCGIARRHRNQERVRGALVVAQVTIGLVLVCGASVLGAGFVNLMQRELGFRPENLLSFRIELPGVRYSTDGQSPVHQPVARTSGVGAGRDRCDRRDAPSADRQQMSVSRSTSRNARRPERAAILEHGDRRTRLLPDNRHADPRGPRLHWRRRCSGTRACSSSTGPLPTDFFPVRAPSASASLWSGIQSGSTQHHDIPRNRRRHRQRASVPARAGAEPIYYFPYKQLPWGPPSVVVRTTLPEAGIANEVRRIVASLDPQVPVHDVRTVRRHVVAGMAAPRLSNAVDEQLRRRWPAADSDRLYGLLAYAVSRRTSEIGVRMALGASRSTIVTMILRRALTLIAIGTVLGGAGAVAGQA